MIVCYLFANADKDELNASAGTGFFISDDGYIITVDHLLGSSDYIEVLHYGSNTKYEAKLIARDKQNDIAILKIDAQTDFIPFANSADIKKGESITLLGYPLIQLLGEELKATFGYINSLSGRDNDTRVLQIDNPSQVGNSGSPLINPKGKVVGMLVSILNQEVSMLYNKALPQNVNYAIKIDYILALISKSGIVLKDKQTDKIYSKKEIVAKYENSVVLILAYK